MDYHAKLQRAGVILYLTVVLFGVYIITEKHCTSYNAKIQYYQFYKVIIFYMNIFPIQTKVIQRL